MALIWLKREPIFLYFLLLQSKIKDSGFLAPSCWHEGWSKSVLFIFFSLLFRGCCRNFQAPRLGVGVSTQGQLRVDVGSRIPFREIPWPEARMNTRTGPTGVTLRWEGLPDKGREVKQGKGGGDSEQRPLWISLGKGRQGRVWSHTGIQIKCGQAGFKS